MINNNILGEAVFPQDENFEPLLKEWGYSYECIVSGYAFYGNASSVLVMRCVV